jgi:hypothetical protein
MSDDEYDQCSFPQFTEAEFSAIDALRDHATVHPLAGPAVTVEVEEASTPLVLLSGVVAQEQSPFEQYRRNGVLSVTDLVSPAWYVSTWLALMHAR